MNCSNIKSVLLVDDDVLLARSLQGVFAKNGLVVHASKNGREAMNWLRTNSADLVITDIYMDEMDGMQLVQSLKQKFPAIKIIAMSGGSSVVALDCLPIAKVLGADRTFAKPTDMDKLLQAVEEIDAEMNA
jgi:DNA-binding NtrC family response regulator